MASSTCIKCGNTTFEIKGNSPSGSLYQFMFVQCSKCGGVVGITGFYDTETIIREIAAKLDIKA